MNFLFSSFLSFILLYKYWAIVAIVFSSSFIVPLPTNAIVLALGAFASQGYLSLPAVYALTIGTNVATDCLVFFLSRRYGARFVERFIGVWDGKLRAAELRVREYAFGTVFLTRIAGPFGPYVNFIAGFIGMPFRKFFLADILGNSLIFGFLASFGYVLGNYWQSFLDDIWVIGAATVAAFLGYLAWKAFRQRRARLK